MSLFVRKRSQPSSSSCPRPSQRRRTIKTEGDAAPATPMNTQSPAPALAPVVGSQLAWFSDEQNAALATICSGRNTLLTGPAGSGKTMVLNQAIRALRDQGIRVRIAAPTGKAAQGIGGTTLHNLFGLTPKSMELSMLQLEKMVEQNDLRRQILAEIGCIFIDEISMVENIFFSRLIRLMQAAKDNDDPFGGAQIVVSGDFFQLSPVKPFAYCFTCGKTTTKDRDRERKVNIYRCHRCKEFEDEPDQWAFCSPAWDTAEFVNINLIQNHRQNEDRFVAILKKLARGATLLRDERRLLYDHDCDVETAVHLYPTNAEVDAMNNTEFDKLEGNTMSYQCLDNFVWSGHDEYQSFRFKSADGHTLAALSEHRYQPVLRLRVEMPVVLTANLDVEGGLVNGSQGLVVAFQNYNEATLPRFGAGVDHGTAEPTATVEQATPETVNLRGGELHYYRQERIKECVVTTNNRQDLPVVQFHCGRKITIFPDCSVSQLGADKPYSLLSRTQIPLVPGWAMTVHKAQGMTMDKVVVNLTKMFCPGQAYVALSRARTLHGLKVEGSEKGLDGAGANPKVTEFMNTTVWNVV